MSGPGDHLLDPLLDASTPHLAHLAHLRRPGVGGSNGGPASAIPQPAPREQAGAESLDYEAVVNSVAIQKQKEELNHPHRRHIYGYTGQTFGRLVATFTAGIAIGLTAAALQLAVDGSIHLRNRLLGELVLLGGHLHGVGYAVAAMLGIGLAAVLLTTLVVHYWAPRAAGGGVALVMAFLNGNSIGNLLSARVYVVKLLGTTASRLAGLALGVEGPMVHLGAAVASLACHGEHVVYRLLNWHRRSENKGSRGRRGIPAEGFLFSNSDHRELVSAGAAAGLAAAFGAPIGGVLFALEEATSVWGRKLAWRCFLCASVACFTMAQLHPRMQSGMLSFRGIYPLTNLQWLIQGPLVIVASACGGLLGCVFNLLKGKARGWRRSHSGISWRLLEAAVVVAVTAAAVTGLPAVAGTCLELPDQWEAKDVMRYRCPEGQYNDLATALLGNGVWVIRSLLSMGSDWEPVNTLCSMTLPCYYSATSLAVLVVAYLALFILASNLIVPGGLFMPCILIGSAFGVLLALMLLQILPSSLDIQPGVYAIVCATAMLGATFRSSISLVVIVVEGTRGIELVFGIIMAVIVSNWVAHHLHPDGVYEAELDRKEGGTWHYLRQEPPHALRSHSAESIMASPAVGLHSVDRVDTVIDVLRRTSHNGFPVLSRPLPSEVAAAGPGGHALGRLQGFVLRSQLLVLLRHGAFCDAQGAYLCPIASSKTDAFQAALDAEMQAAAQASSSEYRSATDGTDSSNSSSGALAALPAQVAIPMVAGVGGSAGGGRGGGRLGPATSLGIAGLGFPTLDASNGASSVQEAAVLDAAADAAAAAAAAAAHDGGVMYLNLQPFMNLAPMAVRPQMPGDRVHHLFLSLSLRHLCVTDSHCRCLGIITRKDIDHASGQGWWRATEIAPTPHQSPRGSPEGASPAAAATGWTVSMESLVRAMAIPPRRLVEALQRFSPQTSFVLPRQQAPASDRAGGAGGGRQRAAPLPVLGGSCSPSNLVNAGGHGRGGGGQALLHSASAPPHVYSGLLEQGDGDSDAALAGPAVPQDVV